VVRVHSPWRTIEDTFDSRIAFTVPDSQSGCVAALSYFLEEHASAHRATLYQEIIAPTVTPLGALDAVVRGAADVAPIDSYAFTLLEQYRPDLTSGVRSVGRTAPTPIPPLVASQPVDPRLRTGFEDAHRDPALRSLMQGLALRRFAAPDPADYAVLADRCAVASQFWGARKLAARIHPAFVHPRP
jgi:ABC-type phosphate/phosphonate transport system substrate-binding protein